MPKYSHVTKIKSILSHISKLILYSLCSVDGTETFSVRLSVQFQMYDDALSILEVPGPDVVAFYT